MSLTSCNTKLMKAYLFHRRSQTYCFLVGSVHTKNTIKCAAPIHLCAVFENSGVQQNLPQRNYSPQKCSSHHHHISKLHVPVSKTNSWQYTKASSCPASAKVFNSTLCTCASFLKDHDIKLCHHQPFKSRLHGTRAASTCTLSLPPAESTEELGKRHRSLRSKKKSRIVLRNSLAKLIVDNVWPGGSLADERALIIETNPGPGILTRQLLKLGAPKVLAMEREKTFLPTLEELSSRAEGRLRAMHADFFSMHYHGSNAIKPPTVRTSKVFEELEPVPWEADVPIKVIGSLPHHKERTHAYIITSQLLERLSSFKYGRVEFNLLMSESCYNVISQPEGHMFNYRALSALMQLSCDITLLHKEPQTSFSLPLNGNPSNSIVNDKDQTLCLVRITPKRDLFINHELSQHQAFIFIYFVRQVLAKRKQRLTKMIEAWAPDHANIIHQFGYNNKTRTGDVKPDDLLRIYTSICQLENFNGSWMGEAVVGYASRALEIDEDEMYNSIVSQGI